MENQDYSAFQDRPTDDKFAELAKLVRAQIDAENDVLLRQKALEDAQAALKQIKEVQLPEFMENTIGLMECTTREGIKIKIDEVIRASITKEKKAAAHALLKKLGAGAIIKHIIGVAFGKNEDEKAAKLSKLLKDNKYEADDVETVHAQTLGAWVRERLAAGTLPDDAQETLGVHRQKFAKLG